jgi:hypothetical protein
MQLKCHISALEKKSLPGSNGATPAFGEKASRDGAPDTLQHMLLPNTMKTTKHRLAFVLLALAGMALAAPALHAQATYNPGDLLLDVRNVGGTGLSGNGYVVDLGQFSNLAASNSPLTNINTDLTNIFGSGWQTNTGLEWSVEGYTTSGTHTLYTTEPESTPGTPNTTTWGSIGSTPLTHVINLEAAAGSTYSTSATGNTATGNGSGVEQNLSDLSTTALAEYVPKINGVGGGAINQPGNIAFNQFNSPGVEAAGLVGSALDLVTSPLGSSGSVLSAFTMDSSGNVYYGLSATPEPGRASLLAFGLGCLVMRRRRR